MDAIVFNQISIVYIKSLIPHPSHFLASHCIIQYFISNIFISNASLNMAKNQAKSMQHPDAELLIFQNYSLFSPMLSSKNSRYSKKGTKNNYVYLNKVIWLTTMRRKLKIKIDRTDTAQIYLGIDMDTNIMNKMCFSIMMVLCIKQHWGWVEKKRCLWKKAGISSLIIPKGSSNSYVRKFFQKTKIS